MYSYLVVGSACLMGLSFGLVFGLMDVEDAKMSHIRIELMREESICYPIGAIIGGNNITQQHKTSASCSLTLT